MSSDSCTLCIHGDLQDLLTSSTVDGRIDYTLDDRVSVKHAIEAVGIVHPEVGRIRVGDRHVAFDYILKANDVVHVCPERPCTSGAPVSNLRPPALQPIRFVLDTHLGRLASYLRLLGVDTVYQNSYDDAELAAISEAEQRVLLTRDRGLLKRKNVTYGRCVRETNPREQLIATIAHYCLAGQIAPWTRCVKCNGLLESVDKSEVLHLLEPKTRRYYTEFSRCVDCGQVYWRGSHFDRIQSFFEGVLSEARHRD